MPEIGSVGMTEQQAKKAHNISIGLFSFGANGRALASGETQGFVKVITDKQYGEVLVCTLSDQRLQNLSTKRQA